MRAHSLEWYMKQKLALKLRFMFIQKKKYVSMHKSKTMRRAQVFAM